MYEVFEHLMITSLNELRADDILSRTEQIRLANVELYDKFVVGLQHWKSLKLDLSNNGTDPFIL